MVAGSLLAKAGWEIRTRSLAPESDLQGLPKKKWRNLQARVVVDLITDLPKNRPRAILDGLLGLGSRSGLKRPPESSHAGAQCAPPGIQYRRLCG